MTPVQPSVVRSSTRIILVLVGLALSLTTAGRAAPEEPIAEATGVFAEGVETPECDDFVDQLESVGDFMVEGAEYLRDMSSEAALGFTDLISHGDPDRFIDAINKSFEDMGTAAVAITKLPPLSFTTIVTDLLPEGKVTDFLRKGADLHQMMQEKIAKDMVEGANPIKKGETAKDDASEIGTDLWKVASNLDAPDEAVNEYLKLQQKWSGAGALTYVFTEDDPQEGLKRAMGAMHRQLEIITTYTKGSPKGFEHAKTLLNFVLNESGDFIDALEDPEDKRAAAALVAAFAVTFRQSLTDPGLHSGPGPHPLYLAQLRDVDAEWMGNDHDSGGRYDWGLMHPKVENKRGCISLGDYAYKDSKPRDTLKAICGVEDGRAR